MLTVVFRTECFRTHVYDRPFTILSDHKPLESITKKNLTDTLAQLQCMLLHLHGYDYVPHYHPGKEMALPDTLSHLKGKAGPEIAFDIPIHYACLSSVQKGALQLAFEMDVKMHALAGLMTSRKSHAYYIPTENTMSHSLLKLNLCFMEKPSSSLHKNGRKSLVPYTNHTEASPKITKSLHHPSIRMGEGPWYLTPITQRHHQKCGCLPMAVFFGLVSTRSLRKLFGNVKHAWDFRPGMLLHHSHQHLPLHIPSRYVHQTS